ncbi:MAG: hypothetical protein U5K43_08295 [Halofilum sp. (in: g-proteobacteria)]|nr:hypothetical protein [Halofilum sp. (in: g-proteobacteria)]
MRRVWLACRSASREVRPGPCRTPQEALAEIAAELREDAGLFLGFHAFGRNGESEGVAGLDHREHESAGLGVSPRAAERMQRSILRLLAGNRRRYANDA